MQGMTEKETECKLQYEHVKYFKLCAHWSDATKVWPRCIFHCICPAFFWFAAPRARHQTLPFDLWNMLYPETQTHIPFQKVKLWNPSHPRVRLPPGFSVHGCAHWQCEHLGRLPNITHITLPRLPQSPHHTTLHCVTVKPNNVIFWALVICSAISSRNSREVGSFWVVVVAKVSINSRNSRNIGEDHFENHLGLRLPLCHHQDYHKLTKSLLLSSSSSPSPS